MKSCCFTGHRVLRDLDAALLDRVIADLIKNGCKRFYCGMAKGFDLAAAESVIALKESYPGVELVACIPCGGQSLSYSASDKRRYNRILSFCSETITLSGDYYKGCMHVRDRFMVDNSDIVLSYLREKRGGTYYTVSYAEKKGLKIISL